MDGPLGGHTRTFRHTFDLLADGGFDQPRPRISARTYIMYL